MPILPSAIVCVLLLSSNQAGAPDLPKAPRGTGGGISRIPAFTWTAPAWQAGDVLTSVGTSHSVLRMRILSDGRVAQEFDQIENRTAEKTITVLESDARGPARLRVQYTRCVSQTSPTGSSGSDEAGDASSLAQRTFQLERDGNTFRVLDAAGKPVDRSLAQVVLAEECAQTGELRRPGDLFARELAGRQIDPGVEVELSRAVARAFVDGHDGFDAVSLKVVLKPEITPEGNMVAAFDARLLIDGTSAAGGDATRVELLGEIRIDVATGRHLSTELSGTLSLAQSTADASRAVEVVGSGPWKLVERVSYGRIE